MSREYLSNPNQNPNPNMNMNPQPPKRDNRVVILLSLILVLLLAAITAFVLIAIKSKDENKENPSDSQSVVVTEQTNPHKTGGLPQAGGELPSIGSSSASSDTQNTATVAPNAQQPQTDATVPPTVPDRPPYSNPAAGDVLPGPLGPQKPANGIPALKYYNAAIDKAVNAKVGYQKTRFTDGEKMDGSAALQAMKVLVYKFMGIGAENVYNETVEKGKWGDVAFLTNSKLTADDVTSATCVEEDSNYVITLTLKSGNSTATQSSHSLPANNALDKCGICVGAEDKGYFDHKTGSVIYDAIDDVYPTAEIKETYTNAKVVATVDPTTGNLISLVVEWNESVTLSKLLGMSATASGVCHVIYKNFKW